MIRLLPAVDAEAGLQRVGRIIDDSMDDFTVPAAGFTSPKPGYCSMRSSSDPRFGPSLAATASPTNPAPMMVAAKLFMLFYNH